MYFFEVGFKDYVKETSPFILLLSFYFLFDCILLITPFAPFLSPLLSFCLIRDMDMDICCYEIDIFVFWCFPPLLLPFTRIQAWTLAFPLHLWLFTRSHDNDGLLCPPLFFPFLYGGAVYS